MDIRELIDLAAAQHNGKAGLARALGKAPPRISEWYTGKHKPEAGEIMRLAEIANLPALSTLVEIQAQLDDKHQAVWANALGKLTAAGIAAGAICVSTLSPSQANAATAITQTVKPTVYIMSTKMCEKMLNLASVASG